MYVSQKNSPDLGVVRLGGGLITHECSVWSGNCRVWSAECKVRSVECKLWSAECKL